MEKLALNSTNNEFFSNIHYFDYLTLISPLLIGKEESVDGKFYYLVSDSLTLEADIRTLYLQICRNTYWMFRSVSYNSLLELA